MKKYVIFAAFAAFLVACSDDDNNNQNQTPVETQKEFFNLKEGNMWVYKRYQSDNEGNNPIFMNITDTVRISGKKEVNGKEYYHIDHSLISENDRYWRINEMDHLVDTLGNVIHPGKDNLYTGTFTVRDFGVLNYKSEPLRNIVIEDNDYIVYPYVGAFVPFSNGLPSERASVIEYQEGTGIITNRARYAASLAYIEDRLVSYDLK